MDLPKDHLASICHRLISIMGCYMRSPSKKTMNRDVHILWLGFHLGPYLWDFVRIFRGILESKLTGIWIPSFEALNQFQGSVIGSRFITVSTTTAGCRLGCRCWRWRRCSLFLRTALDICWSRAESWCTRAFTSRCRLAKTFGSTNSTRTIGTALSPVS